MFSAERILAIRKSRGLSQEMLAEQSGVSLRTIQRVEQGDTVPRGHTLHALAAALGVSLDDFRPEPVPSSTPLTAEAPAAGLPTAAGPLPRFAASIPTSVPVRPPGSVAAGYSWPPLPVPGPRPAAIPPLRSDPEYLQLLNLSALSFLVLPLLNIVVPLWLWRRWRHEVAHAAAVGRRVLGFQILWQVSTTLVYLLLLLGQWVAARYFQVQLPSLYLGVFVASYVLNVAVVGYEALRLRRGRLDVYPVRL